MDDHNIDFYGEIRNNYPVLSLTTVFEVIENSNNNFTVVLFPYVTVTQKMKN